MPETPRDLRRHRCINFRWPTDGSLYRWEFERGGEKLEAAVEGPLIVNEPEIAIRAALDGVGLAYLFDYQVRPFLAAGKLVRLLQEWSPAVSGLLSLLPKPAADATRPARVHRFPAIPHETGTAVARIERQRNTRTMVAGCPFAPAFR